MSRRAFADLTPHERPGKPRSAGLTTLIDWGLPPGAQQDLLDFAGDHLDLAKVAVGISGLIPESALVAKIDGYRAHGIEPFPGGQFLELAHLRGRSESYFAECRRVGYRLIEISDNVHRLGDDERSDLIRRARRDHGLRVLGEVGSKEVASDADALLHDAEVALEAGAWKIMVEAAEFVGSGGERGLLQALLDAFDPELLIFELPGRWIAGVHAHEVHAMMVGLIERLGAEANLANVLPDDVVLLETLRTGLGVTGGKALGSPPG